MDIESIKTPYDLVEITMDKVVFTARPVAWNEEIVDGEGHIADGSVAIPAEFESSCPFCSQMIIFKDGFSEIKCPECDRGTDVKIFIEDPFQDPGKYGEVADDVWQPSDADIEAAAAVAVASFDDQLEHLEHIEIET